MEEQKFYSTNDVARMFGVSGQAITQHARQYGLGSRINKKDYIFTPSDIQEFKKHVGNYGNPKIASVYKEWSLERYREFVEMNRLDPEEGYNYSEEELAAHFGIAPHTVRGMRRRHKLAARICMK